MTRPARSPVETVDAVRAAAARLRALRVEESRYECAFRACAARLRALRVEESRYECAFRACAARLGLSADELHARLREGRLRLPPPAAANGVRFGGAHGRS